MEPPPKTESYIRMSAEVQEPLSHAALDTASQALVSSTPKRPTSAACGAPSSSRAQDTSKPIATSAQASLQVAMPDTTEPIYQTVEVVCTPTTPAS